VYASVDASGASRAWFARLDRRTPPTQLAPPEALGPVFGGDSDVFFRGREGELWYIYHFKLESGQIRKFTSESAVNSPVISPDRHSIRGRVETNAGPGHCQTTGRVSGSDVVRVCLRSELRPTEPAPNHDSAMIYRLALKHSGSNDLSA